MRQFLDPWLEPRWLGIVLAITLTLWLFMTVAGAVANGDAGLVDLTIVRALQSPTDPARPVGPAWLAALARDITALGGLAVLTLLVAAVCGFLLLAGRGRTALFMLLATLSGSWLSSTLKAAFARPRPQLLAHAEVVTSASFPSGHAMLSAIVYLTLGALLARLLPRRRLKLYVMVVALLCSGLVGLSRVYLGAHWPSDVLAGWAAGAAWALGWWGAAEVLRRRQVLQP